ncbi:SusC/RagA family TonB-linked outer membrane protein [Sphingobacterium sp. SRCM116780]|uniref:SusC/RagA family TonB-linked outer membrane protein n=1 Tax=Sphingobacterium sp. SRCM116780 TaxID=2907623 RepID=UPI001F35E032|nr:SusC/RagA family TonB-linked outer membrane protein [Sphingobacterium sp. SRCM116780]UIR56969.1 SusC/RagA family TonB-linked outer membrane protein [Sphingobacterium sp. SRCM116780]
MLFGNLSFTETGKVYLVKSTKNRFLGHQLPYAILLLFLLLTANSAWAQINGSVHAKSGTSIRGVSIINLKNLATTSTNADGQFTIAAHAQDSLRFTAVGFKRATVIASPGMQVHLEEDLVGLEEVVVVGYGTVKKSDLTGSVASVNMKQVKGIPANSIESLLQGRVAGLQITKDSQDPGSGNTVRIRGSSSLNGSNAPLIVVDGFPLGDAGNLKQINPSEILSVEVLKDASASAIYGSRGANGVIMVTTNRAKSGVNTISFRQRTTLSQFSSDVVRWKDGALMAQIDNEARINGNLPPLYIGETASTGNYYPSVNEILTGEWPHFTDWSQVVFRDMPVLSTSDFSINSANDKTSFNLNGSFMNQNGVYIKDNYAKGLVGLNIKHKFNDKFSISTINNASKDRRNQNTGLSYWRNPLWPIYNEDGSYFLNGINDYDHPLAWTDHRKNVFNGTDFISSWIFDWQITPELNAKTTANYKYGNSIQDRFDPAIYTENGTNNNGAAYIDNWQGNVFTSESYLTYDKTFQKRHHLTAMAGYSYENSVSRTSNLESYDFKNGSLGNENMGSGTAELNRHTNGQTETKLESVFGRVNYALDDKYLLTLTIRADGSSKFGANNKWAYFPVAAVSWKMHEESFIKDLDFFNELKIRTSYGVSGNQGISPYQTLSRYGLEHYYNEGTWQTAIGPGYVIGYTGADWRYKLWGGIPNKDLKWETTAQLNLGLDMSIFNNRLRIVADYYDKVTNDLLRERFLPLSSGYDKMWVNDGKIKNEGFEVSLDGQIIRSKDWDFSAAFIFSKNKNTVVSLGNNISSGLTTDYLSGIPYEYYGGNIGPFRETSPNILAVGLPMNVFYGYRVDGILQTDREGAEAGLVGPESKAGEFKYVDLNQDGQFDTRDRTIIGDPNPDFTASLNLSTRYKNFDLSVFLNGVFGQDIMNGGRYNAADLAPLRWTPDNPTNEFPSARQGRLYYTSDWFISDGSFVRIQNVNLGYNLKTEKIKWLKNLRLFVNAENLYTFTKFEGYNPEVGLDGRYAGGYPYLKRFTFGIDFTF